VSNEFRTDVEEIWILPASSSCPDICLQDPSNATTTLSKGSQSPGRDLHPGTPDYKTGVLVTNHDVCCAV
jgi:hypothetical protein